MSRPKKPRLLEEKADTHVGGGDNAVIERSSATVDDLSAEMKAIIFGYFGPTEIMCLRCVCKKWREAAKKTIVPQAPFIVSTIDTYNAMRVMTRAIPNLQRLSSFISNSTMGKIQIYARPKKLPATPRTIFK